MGLGWLRWRAWNSRDAASRRCTFAWQAWHLATSAVVSRGRRGTWGHLSSFAGVVLMWLGWLWWRAWSPVTPRHAAALCVAGVALGDIYRPFTWQAWHLGTSTFVLCGRRATYGTGLALVARLVVLMGLLHTHTHNLSHTIFFTHLGYNHLAHTSLSHTIFHTQLCDTPSSTHTHIFVTHHLSHTSLLHIIFHTQLCHTPSSTHNFVTHRLSHTSWFQPSFTHAHTSLSLTIFHTQPLHIQPFTHRSSTLTCGVIRSVNSRMRSKGSRLGVWGLSCVRQTWRNRLQPFATVRNRSQLFARVHYGCASGKFCKKGHVWSFPASCGFVSRGRRGTLWHSNMFHDVSNVVLCGKRNTFIYFCDVFTIYALHVSWQAQHLGDFRRYLRGRGTTLDVSCCVFSGNRIVSAARSGGKVQIPWKAFCDMWCKSMEASHKTSILR